MHLIRILGVVTAEIGTLTKSDLRKSMQTHVFRPQRQTPTSYSVILPCLLVLEICPRLSIIRCLAPHKDQRHRSATRFKLNLQLQLQVGVALTFSCRHPASSLHSPPHPYLHPTSIISLSHFLSFFRHSTPPLYLGSFPSISLRVALFRPVVNAL